MKLNKSSANQSRQNGDTEGVRKERALPRSVFGPANNCRNLSRRDASLSVMAGVPDVFWSAMRATSGMTGGLWGRERCRCRAACSPADSGERMKSGDTTEGYSNTNTEAFGNRKV